MKYKKYLVYGLAVIAVLSFIAVRTSLKQDKKTSAEANTNTQKNEPAKNTGTTSTKPSSDQNSSAAKPEENKNTKQDITMVDTKNNNIGNSSGNLSNFAQFASQGKWIYFTYPENNNGGIGKNLYRSMKDGETGLKLISENKGILSINVVGEWIYYTDLDNQSSIYKIKNDGTEKTKVTMDSAYQFIVVENWIYYVSPVGIYKIKTDGSGQRPIIEGNIRRILFVKDNYIYYSNLDTKANDTHPDYCSIYKVKLDGSDRSKIIMDNVVQSMIDGDWIYYTNASDNYSLYKAKIDGGSKTRILNMPVGTFNIYNSYIYASFQGGEKNINNDIQNIYRLKTDGSNLKRLTNNAPDRLSSVSTIESILYIYTTDEYLFCIGSNQSGLLLYRVSLDGTSEKVFSN